MTESHCGHIVIAGRPNVGKSTLLNKFIGAHLAATASKPQTTRNRILGIRTEDNYQYVFIDTPGIHGGQTHLLNRVINKTAIGSLLDADVVMFVCEAGQWRDEDEMVLGHLKKLDLPVLLVPNKIDRIKDKAELLPFLQKVEKKYPFAGIIPTSAFREKTTDYLLQQLKKFIPVAEFEFSEDELTDRNMRFISAEMVREQLIHLLQQELPYALAVDIEKYEETEERIFINAVIYVAREGQKKIVIGKNGGLLKKTGTEARRRIIDLAGKPVHLELWVKVKSGWQDNANLLHQFGLDDAGNSAK